MAPRDLETFKWQTGEIIRCLFEDEDEPDQGRSGHGSLEEDSPVHFDPVVIADKLREIGDGINDERMLQAALSDLRTAAAQEAIEAAFSKGVEALCQAQVSQSDVAPEMQLIRASVALGLFVKKSAPELRNKVQGAMMAFLNTRRVSTFVTQQGGWDTVSSV